MSVKFSRSVMSDSATPWIAAHQAFLPITNSQSLLKLMPIKSMMPSSHLILLRPLLLLPPIPPSIRVSLENTHVQKMISKSSLMSAPRGNSTSNRPYEILIPINSHWPGQPHHSLYSAKMVRGKNCILMFTFISLTICEYISYVYSLWLITGLAKEFIQNFCQPNIYLFAHFFLLTCSSHCLSKKF